mmetsp:Transcript_2226/g.2059  ORF Transcript_2226/g.2059 Transcript_2226/m.2059 type:complete len:329 (-) Transcript_2226:137-1123(-)|eukprot:CAMPEP_0197836108 /NCGR_PEP_ID=MMETSP1437-20131217/27965_1 /TAXON_ID=49252 ORGANISM="Eucampia antarctica, Strain CCMP1452" /NCGR_SAMPLE_ID=MMETSP1437 /ASSEMBLY_ACC=CAM_ASM_001096 /LENGTH=328 /DNA_ID=CAMNT_0043442023 /DNA_START=42 /DNA_END=1028 /DNA_ORIENTATION=+
MRISFTRKTGVIAVSIFALLGASVFLTSEPPPKRRQASVALKDGGCFVLPAQEPGPEVKPVFAASYPGSGARMTWNLIEALTGLVTGDEWYSNGRVKDVVTVKTHHPHDQGRKIPWANEIERAFLLIRNPMKAIPSYHNFLYEFENKLENHSTRAPVEAWIKWRDQFFISQLEVWKNHMEFWLDSYDPKNRIVVPYEHLINPTQGPLVTEELNEFLGRGPGVTPIPQESVKCVWGTVVNYKSGNVPNSRQPLPKDVKFVGNYPIFPSSSRDGPKERPYTEQQLDALLITTDQMRRKYNAEGGRIRSSLEMYIGKIQEAKVSLRNASLS